MLANRCPLCNKSRTKAFRQHLRQFHKWTKEQANIWRHTHPHWAESTRRSLKSKLDNPLKHCPVNKCQAVVCNITDHLIKSHGLKKMRDRKLRIHLSNRAKQAITANATKTMSTSTRRRGRPSISREQQRSLLIIVNEPGLSQGEFNKPGQSLEGLSKSPGVDDDVETEQVNDVGDQTADSVVGSDSMFVDRCPLCKKSRTNWFMRHLRLVHGWTQKEAKAWRQTHPEWDDPTKRKHSKYHGVDKERDHKEMEQLRNRANQTLATNGIKTMSTSTTTKRRGRPSIPRELLTRSASAKPTNLNNPEPSHEVVNEPERNLRGSSKSPEKTENTTHKSLTLDQAQNDLVIPKKRKKRGSRKPFYQRKKKGQYVEMLERIALRKTLGILTHMRPRKRGRGPDASRGTDQRRDLNLERTEAEEEENHTSSLSIQKRQTRREVKTVLPPETREAQNIDTDMDTDQLRDLFDERTISDEAERYTSCLDKEKRHKQKEPKEAPIVIDGPNDKIVLKPNVVTDTLMSTTKVQVTPPVKRHRRRRKIYYSSMKDRMRSELYKRQTAAGKTSAQQRKTECKENETFMLIQADDKSGNSKTDDINNVGNTNNGRDDNIRGIVSGATQPVNTDSASAQSKTWSSCDRPSRRNRKSTCKFVAYSMNQQSKAARKSEKKIKIIENKDECTKDENDGSGTTRETMYIEMSDRDAKLFTKKVATKPNVVTDTLMSTTKVHVTPPVKKRRRKKKIYYSSMKERIHALKLAAAKRSLQQKAQPQEEECKDSKSPVLIQSEEEYEHDKTDNRDDEENTIDVRHIVSTVVDLAESVATDSASAQNKTLSSCDRSRRRNRKPLRFLESEDDDDCYYPANSDDDPVYKEKPYEKRQRLSNVSLPTVQDQEPLILIDGLNKKLYCGFAQVVSTASRVYHCMFCSFESTAYNTIGTHVSDEHSTLSTTWFAKHAVMSTHDSHRSRAERSENIFCHTVYSSGSMFCCYVGKCTKRFLHESQFITHHIAHTFPRTSCENNCSIDSSLSDSDVSARCSSNTMAQALSQRTKRHSNLLVGSLSTIVDGDFNDDVKCDDNEGIKCKLQKWTLVDPKCHCRLGKCEMERFSSAEELRQHCLTVHKVIKNAELFYCGYCPYACTDMQQGMIHSSQKHPIKHDQHKRLEATQPLTQNVLATTSSENSKVLPPIKSNVVMKGKSLTKSLPISSQDQVNNNADFVPCRAEIKSACDSIVTDMNKQSSSPSCSFVNVDSNRGDAPRWKPIVLSKSNLLPMIAPKLQYKHLSAIHPMFVRKETGNVQLLVINTPNKPGIQTKFGVENVDSHMKPSRGMSGINATSSTDSQDNVGANMVGLSEDSTKLVPEVGRDEEMDLAQSQEDDLSTGFVTVTYNVDCRNGSDMWSQLNKPLEDNHRATLSTNSSGYDSCEDSYDDIPCLTKYGAPHMNIYPISPQSSPLSVDRQGDKEKDNIAVPMHTRPLFWGPKCKRDVKIARQRRVQKQILAEHAYSIAPLPDVDVDEEPPTLTPEVHRTVNVHEDVKLSKRAIVIAPDIIKELLKGY